MGPPCASNMGAHRANICREACTTTGVSGCRRMRAATTIRDESRSSPSDETTTSARSTNSHRPDTTSGHGRVPRALGPRHHDASHPLLSRRRQVAYALATSDSSTRTRGRECSPSARRPRCFHRQARSEPRGLRPLRIGTFLIAAEEPLRNQRDPQVRAQVETFVPDPGSGAARQSPPGVTQPRCWSKSAWASWISARFPSPSLVSPRSWHGTAASRAPIAYGICVP